MLRQVHGSPNYTYLKLKMSGPNGVITMGSTFSHAFTCDREHYELVIAVINSFKLPWLGELSIPTALVSSSGRKAIEGVGLLQSRTAGVDNSPSRGSSEDFMMVVASF